MGGEGHHAEMIARLFRSASRRAGLNQHALARLDRGLPPPGAEQLTLVLRTGIGPIAGFD